MDAALIALHRSQHVSTVLNGAAVSAGQLDQNKISKTEFRVERVTLSVQDRLVLRKLFQSIGISCKGGEEGARAGEFLMKLIELARSAGGDAPLPAAPAVTDIEDIQRLVGNEQLTAIKDKSAEWEKKIKQWAAAKQTIAERLPKWQLVERLAKHAGAIDAAKQQLDQIEAVRTERLLLDSSDPVSSIRVALADLLRKAVQDSFETHQTAFRNAMQSLDANDVWRQLSGTDQEQIKATVGLKPPSKPNVATDDALASHLDQKPLASAQAEIDAIPGRVAQAIERAAKHLLPKVQTIQLERSTLRDKAEVQGWIERQKKVLLEAVAKGPVLVN